MPDSISPPTTVPAAAAPVTTAVVNTDQVAQQHLGAIADFTVQATGDPTQVKDIQPAFEQHPLEGIAKSIVNISDPTLNKTDENESELVDVIKGLQGKPRTGKAIDFLKEKMQLLANKSGGQVSLVKKDK